MTNLPPKQLPELLDLISNRHASLSKRLKQVATFALEQPNTLALETVAVISKLAEVPPSTLVRFANALGYEGFSDMQAVFRQKLATYNPSYSERVRLANAGRQDPLSSSTLERPNILHEFVESDILALQHLSESVSAQAVEDAVKLLAEADTIHVIGMRRSFPVASYIAYSLIQLRLRVNLLDGMGGFIAKQLQTLRPKDILIAISFTPYAEETKTAVNYAIEHNVKMIALSDSLLSPLASPAEIYFEVKNAEFKGFRSLMTPLCLAQALIVNLAFFLEDSE